MNYKAEFRASNCLNVYEIDESNLSQNVYTFYLASPLQMTLDKYSKDERKSIRHKFKSISSWERLRRDNTLTKPESVSEFILAFAIEFWASNIKYEHNLYNR